MYSNPEDYSKQELKEFRGHKDEVNCMSFSLDFSFLLTGSDDQRVRVFNVKTKQCIIKLKGHEGAINSVAVSPCSKYFASGSFDKTARIWQTATGECLHILTGHHKSIETVNFSPTSAWLCTGSWDRTAILWCVQTGCLVYTFRGHTSLVQTVAFSWSRHNMLASGSWDCSVRVWTLDSDHYRQVIAVHRSQNYHRQHESLSHPKMDDHSKDLKEMDKERNEYQEKNAEDAWEETGEEKIHPELDKVGILLGHTGNVYTVAFSKLGMLASGSWDRTVRLWNPWTGVCVRLLEGHTGWVKAVCFSPDATYAASAADDDFVKVWDIPSGTCVNTLQGDTDLAHSCSFTPQGVLVASGAAVSNIQSKQRTTVDGEDDVETKLKALMDH